MGACTGRGSSLLRAGDRHNLSSLGRCVRGGGAGTDIFRRGGGAYDLDTWPGLFVHLDETLLHLSIFKLFLQSFFELFLLFVGSSFAHLSWNRYISRVPVAGLHDFSICNSFIIIHKYYH